MTSSMRYHEVTKVVLERANHEERKDTQPLQDPNKTIDLAKYLL